MQLYNAQLWEPPTPTPLALELRLSTCEFGSGFTKVEALASFDLIGPDDTLDVALVASSGSAPAVFALKAMKKKMSACVCIDADFGIDGAGIALLAALDQQEIPAASASVFSCRLGDPRSLLDDGYISAVNEVARRLGGMVGQSTKRFVQQMVWAREVSKRQPIHK